MPELLVLPEPLLKRGYYVHFSKNWHELFADKYFVIGPTQQIAHKLHRIINQGKEHDIDLEEVGLIPTNPETLYEILAGFKGNLLLYPRLPSTDWYLKLEKSGFVPVPDDDVKRYIGCYTQEDMPYDKLLFREYTVKEMETPMYRFYNDSTEPEKLVLRLVVNRCHLIRELTKEEVEEIIRKRIPVREIPHYKDMVW